VAQKGWIGKEMPEPQQGGLGEIREVVQKELQKMRYEVFCDMAYFDQWAVRPVGVSRWGHCYHLPSKEEAEGLAKQLEELEAERDDARDWLGSYKESVAIAAREINNLENKNAKLRDIAERAIGLAVQYYDGPCERDAAKLRAELDQLKEAAK
jgi:hypothetical protein